MKRILTIFSVLAFGVGSVFAQKGEMAVGANINYGTEGSIGFGAKYQYNILDALRIEPSFDYYVGEHSINMFDINVNAHYLFDVVDKVKVYPLFGLGFTSWGASGDFAGDGAMGEYMEVSSSSSRLNKIAVNVGVGGEYLLSEKIAINLEMKYQIISNFNQFVIGVGVAYKF